jgi:hypothetical protein
VKLEVVNADELQYEMVRYCLNVAVPVHFILMKSFVEWRVRRRN